MANDVQPNSEPAANGASKEHALVPAVANEVPASNLMSPYAGRGAFETAQRMARSLASSSLVPAAYQGEKGMANCLIAMELASRIGVSVLAVMQNLHIIQGKPSWSSQFLIATVNASGRFTPLRFEVAGEPGKDSWACRAVATDKQSSERCEGPWITWSMATKEGWTKKNSSKWQTMPELMFRYRAAAFWSRIYCPEISIGFHTTEELADMSPGVTAVELPQQLSPAGAASLNAVLGLQKKAPDAPEGSSGDVIDAQQELPQ